MASDQRPTIGDYFTLQRGTTYKSSLLGHPGPVLLGLATINRNGGFRDDSLKTYGGESPEKLLVRPGELYLSLKDVTQSADLLGAVARLPYTQRAGRLTQDTVRLEPRHQDVPLEYLYWLLRTPQYRAYCRAHATGTTNLGLAREDFLSFPVPALTERRAHTVEALQSLDEKIELNRRMNETLEEMARALFKSWFVDFDPVRAKAEGRDPGLPQHLADLFPDRLVDSDLGPIPEGWDVTLLGDVLELAYGKALKASERRNGDVTVFGSNGPVGFHDVPLADAPGIVVGRKGTPGAVWWSPRPFWPIDTTFYVKSRLPGDASSYLFHMLRGQELADLSADSAVPGLNRNAVYSRKHTAPPRRIREEFEGICESLRRRADVGSAQSGVIARLRDALLPALLEGRFDVPSRATSVRVEAGRG